MLDIFSYKEIQEDQKMGILMPFRNTAWSGSFRVMVNFCKATQKKERIVFILFKGKKALKEHVEQETGIDTEFLDSNSELIDLMRRNNIKMLIGDDAIPRLKLLENVKEKSKIETLIYVQFLYGVHKIFPILGTYSTREKLNNILLKAYPWFLLRSTFKTLLSKHEILIANSKSTATLLQLLYGLSVCGVVHPLIDTKIFRPTKKVSEDIITIYSGSKAGDTSLALLGKAVDLLLDYGKVINVFGENIEVVKKSLTNHSRRNINFYKDISDDDLAEIYSNSYLTIAPQIFELFGYVPIESMACGTPVLAFDYLGPSETISPGKTGWLAISEKDLINRLRRIIAEGYNEEMRKKAICHVVERFSTEASNK